MTDWNKDDKSAIEASEMGGGVGLGEATLAADDLDNKWAYGNCFVTIWKWISGKWKAMR